MERARLFRRLAGALACVVILTLAMDRMVGAAPITTKEGVLPIGTDLNEDLLDQPTELFAAELAGGKRSYLVKLGDMLFSSSAILGGPAAEAGMSCESCHQQGAGNSKLFIPGSSLRPGTFDTTGPFFNPKADDGVLDALTPPSLRGAKYLAPYGHDGRFASLRDFVHNVIVNEFAGPEPSAEVLDALVAYLQDIAFLPNAALGADGRLTDKAPDAARRGEVLFNKPFPHDPTMSCATCHQPASAFVDHQQHDVGSGGAFKTPTLVNADFNGPYFHDGRFDSYDQVVAYFDHHFDLGLSNDDRSDLVAYLNAVGNADAPFTNDTVQAELDEIGTFASVLDSAMSARNQEIITIAVDTIGSEWRELGENFPERSDPTVLGGQIERRQARNAVANIVLTLREIDMKMSDGDYDAAAAALAAYHQQAMLAESTLKSAEPWSLFNPSVREAHFGALQQLSDLAK